MTLGRRKRAGLSELRVKRRVDSSDNQSEVLSMRKKPLNKLFLFACGAVSLLAGVLSILANLGYVKPLKHALGLP